MFILVLMKLNDLLIELSKKGDQLKSDFVSGLMKQLDFTSFKMEKFCFYEKNLSSKNLISNTENFALYTCVIQPGDSMDLKANCSQELSMFSVINNIDWKSNLAIGMINSGECKCFQSLEENLIVKNNNDSNSILIVVLIKDHKSTCGEVNGLCESFDAINGMAIAK